MRIGRRDEELTVNDYRVSIVQNEKYSIDGSVLQIIAQKCECPKCH